MPEPTPTVLIPTYVMRALCFSPATVKADRKDTKKLVAQPVLSFSVYFTEVDVTTLVAVFLFR